MIGPRRSKRIRGKAAATSAASAKRLGGLAVATEPDVTPAVEVDGSKNAATSTSRTLAEAHASASLAPQPPVDSTQLNIVVPTIDSAAALAGAESDPAAAATASNPTVHTANLHKAGPPSPPTEAPPPPAESNESFNNSAVTTALKSPSKCGSGVDSGPKFADGAPQMTETTSGNTATNTAPSPPANANSATPRKSNCTSSTSALDGGDSEPLKSWDPGFKFHLPNGQHAEVLRQDLGKMRHCIVAVDPPVFQNVPAYLLLKNPCSPSCTWFEKSMLAHHLARDNPDGDTGEESGDDEEDCEESATNGVQNEADPNPDDETGGRPEGQGTEQTASMPAKKKKREACPDSDWGLSDEEEEEEEYHEGAKIPAAAAKSKSNDVIELGDSSADEGKNNGEVIQLGDSSDDEGKNNTQNEGRFQSEGTVKKETGGSNSDSQNQNQPAENENEEPPAESVDENPPEWWLRFDPLPGSGTQPRFWDLCRAKTGINTPQFSAHRFGFHRPRPTGLTFGIDGVNLVVTDVTESSMGELHGVKVGDVILLPVGCNVQQCLNHANDLKKNKRPFYFEVIRPFIKKENYCPRHDLAMSRVLHRVVIDDPTPLTGIRFKLKRRSKYARKQLHVTRVKSDSVADIAGLRKSDIIAVTDTCGTAIFDHTSPPWMDPESERPLVIDLWRVTCNPAKFKGESMSHLRWMYGVIQDNPFRINVPGVLGTDDSDFNSEGSDFSCGTDQWVPTSDLSLSSSWCPTDELSLNVDGEMSISSKENAISAKDEMSISSNSSGSETSRGSEKPLFQTNDDGSFRVADWVEDNNAKSAPGEDENLECDSSIASNETTNVCSKHRFILPKSDPPGVSFSLDAKRGGLIVFNVMPGSPAHNHGLLVGDLVLPPRGLGADATKSLRTMRDDFNDAAKSGNVAFEVMRRQVASAEASVHRFVVISSRLSVNRSSLNIDSSPMARVQSVMPNSAGDVLGIKAGDEICVTGTDGGQKMTRSAFLQLIYGPTDIVVLEVIRRMTHDIQTEVDDRTFRQCLKSSNPFVFSMPDADDPLNGKLNFQSANAASMLFGDDSTIGAETIASELPPGAVNNQLPCIVNTVDKSRQSDEEAMAPLVDNPPNSKAKSPAVKSNTPTAARVKQSIEGIDLMAANANNLQPFDLERGQMIQAKEAALDVLYIHRTAGQRFPLVIKTQRGLENITVRDMDVLADVIDPLGGKELLAEFHARKVAEARRVAKRVQTKKKGAQKPSSSAGVRPSSKKNGGKRCPDSRDQSANTTQRKRGKGKIKQLSEMNIPTDMVKWEQNDMPSLLRDSVSECASGHFYINKANRSPIFASRPGFSGPNAGQIDRAIHMITSPAYHLMQLGEDAVANLGETNMDIINRSQFLPTGNAVYANVITRKQRHFNAYCLQILSINLAMCSRDPPVYESKQYPEYNAVLLSAIRTNMEVLHRRLYGGDQGIRMEPPLEKLLEKKLDFHLKKFDSLKQMAKCVIADWSDAPTKGDRFMFVNHYGILSVLMKFNEKLVHFKGNAKNMICPDTKLFLG